MCDNHFLGFFIHAYIFIIEVEKIGKRLERIIISKDSFFLFFFLFFLKRELFLKLIK